MIQKVKKKKKQTCRSTTEIFWGSDVLCGFMGTTNNLLKGCQCQSSRRWCGIRRERFCFPERRTLSHLQATGAAVGWDPVEKTEKTEDVQPLITKWRNHVRQLVLAQKWRTHMRQLEQHQKQRRVRSLAEKWQSHTRQLEQWQKQRRQLAQRQAKWPSHMRQLEHQQGRQLAERQAKWQSHVRQLEQQQRRHCQLAEKEAKLQHERPDACKVVGLRAAIDGRTLCRAQPSVSFF